MNRCLLTILLLVSHEARATTLDEVVAAALRAARTPAELARVRADAEQLNVARGACRLQLKRDQAPLACYEVLALEVRFHLHSPAQEARLRQRLDQKCEIAARNLHVSAASTATTSRSCQRALSQAQQVQAYIRSGDADWSGN